MGSKNRFAKELVPIIQKYIVESGTDTYVEPFVGGRNVIDKVKCKHRYGYDINKYLIALLKQARDDCTVFPETITEDEYKTVRANFDNYPEWYVGLVGFCGSFASKFFAGYGRHNNRTKYRDPPPTEAIRNIVKQAPNLKGIEFECCDFRELDDLKGCVIYCDPPYNSTTRYKTGKFPYEEFYEWCKEKRKDNIVLVSEYEILDTDFKCIWQKDTAVEFASQRAGGITSDKKKRIERLFIVKND